MSKYDVSIPRKMYWSNKIQSTTVCPECGGDLEEESHSYVLLVKKGIENAQYIIGNNGGNFCKKCPVVVLSKQSKEEDQTDLIFKQFMLRPMVYLNHLSSPKPVIKQ